MLKEKQNTLRSTKVVFSQEARRELFDGLNITAEAVMCTLGPKGKTVLIQKDDNVPVITKDGVTVSKSINLNDPLKRMGSELIREAASRTNDIAGDGTTTATVLTHAMVKSGLKLLEAGYSAQDLCKGIEWGTAKVMSYLTSVAKQLTSVEEISQIGTISANGERNIGDLIASAMEKVGRNGIITVEDAKGMNTTLEIVEGMQFDRGYLSPYFVTNSEKMNVTFYDAKVLLTDKKISVLKDLIPILEKTMQSRTPLLIIADEVEGEALQGLVLNKLNANLQVVAIKSPGFGKHKDELLSDISTLTGAKLISNSTGVKLETITFQDLGTLKKVVIDAKSSMLVASGATKKAIDARVEELNFQIQDLALTTDDVAKLKVRIAKLSSGVAVIKVGGATELEMVERKYRIEDALNATRAATDEGVVSGGGMALFQAANLLKENQELESVKAGIGIVIDACLAPLKRIVYNAGCNGDVVINELNRLNNNLGYNAAKGIYEDLIVAGVIDPVKVTRTALKNASSVAMTFLNLDAVIVEEVSRES